MLVTPSVLSLTQGIGTTLDSDPLGLLGQVQPGVNHRIRIQGDAAEPLLQQPLCPVRVVLGALTADAHVFALPREFRAQ